MCFQLVGHALVEVLGAQDRDLTDAVGSQLPFGVDHQTLLFCELVDSLPECAKDRPDHLGFRSHAGDDADGEHARLLSRKRAGRLHCGDVVFAVDDHLDRGAQRAVPSWEIALRTIALSIRSEGRRIELLAGDEVALTRILAGLDALEADTNPPIDLVEIAAGLM